MTFRNHQDEISQAVASQKFCRDCRWHEPAKHGGNRASTGACGPDAKWFASAFHAVPCQLPPHECQVCEDREWNEAHA